MCPACPLESITKQEQRHPVRMIGLPIASANPHSGPTSKPEKLLVVSFCVCIATTFSELCECQKALENQLDIG